MSERRARWLIGLIGLVAIMCAGPTLAQTPEAAAALAQAAASTPPVASTLSGAVGVALDNRTEIKSANARVEGLRARVKQALSRYYPSLDFAMTTERAINYDVFSGVTGRVDILGESAQLNVQRTVPRYTAVPSLRLTYDAYTGGRDAAALDSNRARLRSGETEALIASRNVVRDVALAYLQLRKTVLQYEGAAKWVDHYTRREETGKVRLQEGRVSDLEYRSEVLALAERKVDMRRLEQDIEARIIDYYAAVGLAEPPRAGTVTPPPDFQGGLDTEIASIAKWADSTLEISKSEADIEAAQFRVRAERADFYPQLRWYIQYAGVGRSEQDVWNSFGNLRRRDYLLGFTVSYNLFSGFNSTAKVEEALAETNRVALDLDRAHRTLQQNTRKLQVALDRESATLDLLGHRRELARLRLKIAETKVAAGTDTQVALEQAAVEDADAERSLDVAKIDRAIAHLRLMFASVADVTEDGVQRRDSYAR